MKKLLVALVALFVFGAAYAQTQAPMRPQALAVDSGTKTATAVAGAATLNKNSGIITSEALVTAGGGSYVLTLTNTQIKATDIVLGSAVLGTATTGVPVFASAKPAAGSVVITVNNIGAAVFNGTIKVAFVALRGD